MQGVSERQYAARVGLSRGAIQKAKEAGRLVLHPDGSIDAAASDARRAAMTDPSKSRAAPTVRPVASPAAPRLKPVPEAAVAAVGDTLREQGLAAPAVGGGTTFLQARTANDYPVSACWWLPRRVIRQYWSSSMQATTPSLRFLRAPGRAASTPLPTPISCADAVSETLLVGWQNVVALVPSSKA